MTKRIAPEYLKSRGRYSDSRSKCPTPLRWWRASGDRALDFLGRFFLRLAFYQRDLLDARGIGWTPGGDLGIVFESIVNEASLVGIHRFKLKRTAGDAHALSQLTHPLHNSIFAH